MILVNKTNPGQLAHWPIPESFWPTRETRPIRTAIPLLYFSSESKRVNVLENLPFDKYELEPSPLTQYILEMRQPTICWQTFVKSSGRDKGQCLPFDIFCLCAIAKAKGLNPQQGGSCDFYISVLLCCTYILRSILLLRCEGTVRLLESQRERNMCKPICYAVQLSRPISPA
jgi:hypothetical protein